MNPITTAHLDHLTTFLDDRDAPPQSRAAVTEALDRYRAALDHRDTLRTERRNTATALDEYRRTAPTTIVEQYHRGTVDLVDLTAHLDHLTTRLDHLGAQELWLSRTARALAHEVTSCLADHLAVLVPYIASHRARLPLTHDVPAHIAYLWGRIAGRVVAVFPYDSCTVDGDRPDVMLPMREALTLGRNERHRWAWAAIYLGQTDTRERDGVVEYRIGAEWADRSDLVDMVTDASLITTPPTTFSRRLGASPRRRT